MACTVCGSATASVLVCDGKLGKGKTCPAKYCFSCAGVSAEPPGEWFCRACKGKRQLTPSTPSSQADSKRVHTVSPDLAAKVRTALAKDKLPTFPAGQGTSSASGSGSSFGVSEAFTLVAGKLEQIDNKLSSVVTSDQLFAVKTDLLLQFEKTVEELRAAFAKLENENKELRLRVDELERRLNGLKTGSAPANDVAFKRLSFIGFPLSDAEGRLKFVKEWMASYFGSFTFSVGNVFRGPANKRELTAVVYVEFSDTDTRNLVLKKLKSDAPSCTYSGSLRRVFRHGHEELSFERA